MSDVRINFNFLNNQGGEMYGDLVMATGANIDLLGSGTTSIGSPSHPLGTVYANNIIATGIGGNNFVSVTGGSMYGNLNFSGGAGITTNNTLSISTSDNGGIFLSNDLAVIHETSGTMIINPAGIAISDYGNQNSISLSSQGIGLAAGSNTNIILNKNNGITTVSNVAPIASGVDNVGSISNPYNSAYINNLYISGSKFNPNSLFVPNVISVSQYSSGFNSIAAAVNSISDASLSKPYVVFVEPGNYSEPTITVPSYVTVAGRDENTVAIQSIGNNDLFNLSTLSSLAFLSIQNVPSGYVAINIHNPHDYVLMHKVSLQDVDTAIRMWADDGADDHQVYLEYVDTTQDNTTKVGFDFISESGSSALLSCENFYVFGGDTNPPIGVRASGNGLSMATRASALYGFDNTGIGLEIHDGANVTLPVLGVINWATGITTVAGANAPKLNAYSVSFRDNDINLVIGNTGTTGFLASYSPYELNVIPENSPFFVANKDQRIVTVAKKGGDFSSIAEAINAISGIPTAENIYTIQVNPGIYTEPPMVVPSYVTVQGDNMESVIISPSGDYNLFTMSNASDLDFMTIFGNGQSSTSSAVVLDSIGSYTTLHKVYINDFNKGITALNSVSGVQSYAYLEYTSIQTQNSGLPSYALSIQSNWGAGDSIFSIDAQNFTIYGYNQNPTDGIFASGRDVQLLAKTFSFQGNDTTGDGIHIENGAAASLEAGEIQNFNNGINVAAVGVGPNVIVEAVDFQENGSLDLKISNTGTTGHSSSIPPYLKTYIAQSSQFYLVGNDQHSVTVAVKGSNFTSVKDAVDSIHDAGPSNKYIVNIGPGTFVENNPIQLKPYVSLAGVDNVATTIYAGNPNAPLFSGSIYSSLNNMTLAGSLGSGNYLFDWYNTAGDGFMNLFNVVAGPTYGIARVQGITGISTNMGIFNMKSLDVSNIQTGFSLVGYPSPVSGTQVAIHLQNNLFYDAIAPYTNQFIDVNGHGTLCQIDDTFIQNSSVQPSSIAVQFYNGADVRLYNTIFNGFDVAISGSNVGDPSRIIGNALTILDCNSDIYIDHPNTSGTLAGTFARTKTTINSPDVVNLSNDPKNFATISVGDFYAGPSQNLLTEMTDAWIQTPTMGLTSTAVALTQLPPASGLTVRVNAGVGYVDSSNLIKLTWPTQNLTLSPNDDVYVYINAAGNVATSVTSINGQFDKILLGRVFCGPTFVLSVGNISMDAHHNGNKVDEYLRDVFGSIVADGMIITPTGLQLNMSGGEYYYSSHNWSPSSKTPIPNFYQFYHVSGTFTASTNVSGVVNNTQYDNGVNLTGLSAGYYTKHGLWYVGTNDQTLFVFGQNQYASLTGVQAASSPAAPEPFKDAVVHIADIIVQQGSGTIVQIEDTRPTPSYKAPSTISQGQGVTVHAQLLGLLADDHTQYLLTNGSRAMGASLNMGGFDISNVGLVGGIIPSGHAGGHLPNGIDPISTAAPTTNLNANSSNSVGIQNTLARSDHGHGFDIGSPTGISALSNGDGISSSLVRADHIHAHGALTGTSLHNVVSDTTSGFMSSAMYGALTGVTTGGPYLPLAGGTMSGTILSDVATTIQSVGSVGIKLNDPFNVQSISMTSAGVNIQSSTLSGGQVTIVDQAHSNNNITLNHDGIALNNPFWSTSITQNSGNIALNNTINNRFLFIDSTGIWINDAYSNKSVKTTITGLFIEDLDDGIKITLAADGFSVIDTRNFASISSTGDALNVSGQGALITLDIGGIHTTGNISPKVSGVDSVGSVALPYLNVYGTNVYENGVKVVTTGVGLGNVTVTTSAGIISVSGQSTPPIIITGTAPINVTGSTIGIGQASSTTNGYLSSGDWNTFNTSHTIVSGTSPVLVTGSTVSIGQATASTSGYLSSADWTTFNGKQSAGNYVVSGTSTSLTVLNVPVLSGTVINATSITGTAASFTSITGAVASFTSITGNTIYQNGAQVLTTGIGLGTVAVSVSNGVITITGTSTGSTTIITGTSPILVTGSTIGIGQATVSTSGYLSSADWNTFNGKQTAGNYIVSGTSSSLTVLNVPVLSGTVINTNSITGAVGVFTNITGSFANITLLQGTSALFTSITGTSLSGTTANVATVNAFVAVNTPLITGTTASFTSITGNTIYQNGLQVLTTGIGLGTVAVSVSNGVITITGTSTGSTTIITGTSPILVTGSTVGIGQSTTSTNGYLSSTDWNTFNGKQPSGNYVVSGTSTGLNNLTVSGLSVNTTGVSGTFTIRTQDNGTANNVLVIMNSGMTSPIFTIRDDGYVIGTSTVQGSQGIFNTMSHTSNNATLNIQSRNFTSPISGISMLAAASVTNSSGTFVGVSVNPVLTQSGTAGYTALQINPTLSVSGSGPRLLFDAQLNNVSQFSISDAGIVNANAGIFSSITGATISGTTGIVSTLNSFTSIFSPIVGGSLHTGTTASFTSITGTTIYQNGIQVLTTGIGLGNVAVSVSNGVITITGTSGGGSSTGGVTSLNNLSGTVSILGSGNVSVTTSGNSITINGTSGTATLTNTVSEIPVGTINGINAGFTISQTPASGSMQLYLNGVYMAPSGSHYTGFDYTISGLNITMQTPPLSNSTIYAVYATTIQNNFIYNEVPSGSANGINAVFTLAHQPIPSSTQVFLNGIYSARYLSGGLPYDYSISGSSIVFQTAPFSGSTIFVNYID